MKNDNFTVKCPNCGEINDFSGANWCDSLIYDKDTTILGCMHCSKPMAITTHTSYSLTAEIYEFENYKNILNKWKKFIFIICFWVIASTFYSTNTLEEQIRIIASQPIPRDLKKGGTITAVFNNGKAEIILNEEQNR